MDYPLILFPQQFSILKLEFEGVSGKDSTHICSLSRLSTFSFFLSECPTIVVEISTPCAKQLILSLNLPLKFEKEEKNPL